MEASAHADSSSGQRGALPSRRLPSRSARNSAASAHRRFSCSGGLPRFAFSMASVPRRRAPVFHDQHEDHFPPSTFPRALSPEWMTLEEAGAALGCSVMTVRRRIAAGALRALHSHGRVVVRADDVTALSASAGTRRVPLKR